MVVVRSFMARTFVERTEYRGGSDDWDVGTAGTIVTNEFFGEPPPTGGRLKYWDGAAWAYATLKRWTGTVWQTTALKFWNGTSWELTH